MYSYSCLFICLFLVLCIHACNDGGGDGWVWMQKEAVWELGLFNWSGQF